MYIKKPDKPLVPLPITMVDAANEKKPPSPKVRVPDLKKRVKVLSEDTIFIAEMSIARWRVTMETTQGCLEPNEHRLFLQTAEQVRKLRVTANELSKEAAPQLLSEDDLDDEFEDLCRAEGLDPDAVKRVLGL